MTSIPDLVRSVTSTALCCGRQCKPVCTPAGPWELSWVCTGILLSWPQGSRLPGVPWACTGPAQAPKQGCSSFSAPWSGDQALHPHLLCGDVKAEFEAEFFARWGLASGSGQLLMTWWIWICSKTRFITRKTLKKTQCVVQCSLQRNGVAEQSGHRSAGEREGFCCQLIRKRLEGLITGAGRRLGLWMLFGKSAFLEFLHPWEDCGHLSTVLSTELFWCLITFAWSS